MRTEIHTAKLAIELLQKSIEKLEKSIEANNDANNNADQKYLREKVIIENYQKINDLRDVINRQLNSIKISAEGMSATDKFDLAYINKRFPELENSVLSIINNNQSITLEFRPYKKTIDEQLDKKAAIKELKDYLIESVNTINLTTEEKRQWVKTIEKTVLYNENKSDLKNKLKKLEAKQLQMMQKEEDIKRELNELLATNFENKEQLFTKMKEFIVNINSKNTKELMKELNYPENYFQALVFTKEFQAAYVKKHKNYLVDNIMPQITQILSNDKFNYSTDMIKINDILSSEQVLFVGKNFIQEVMVQEAIKTKFGDIIVKGVNDNITDIWSSTISGEKYKFGRVYSMAGVLGKLPDGFLDNEQASQLKNKIIQYVIEARKEAVDIKISTPEQLQNLLTIKDKFAGVKHIVNIVPKLDEQITEISNKLLTEMNNNLREVAVDKSSDSLEKIANKLNLIQQNISEFNKLVPGQLDKKLPLLANYINEKLTDINLEAQARLEALVNDDILNNKRVTYNSINKIHKFMSNIYGVPPKEINALFKTYKDQYRNFVEVDINNIVNNSNISFVDKIICINSINEFMETKGNLRIENQYDNLVSKIPSEVEIILADKRMHALKKLAVFDEMYKILKNSTGIYNAPALAKLKEAEKKLVIDVSSQLTNISLNILKSISIEEFLTNADTSLGLKKIVDYSNNVGNYIMRNICEQSDPHIRKILLNRWLSVGEKCLALGDIPTAKAIMTNFASILINFPITFNSLSSEQKTQILKYGKWSEQGVGWKKVIGNKEIVGLNSPLPDIGEYSGRLVGIKEANCNWNDSNMVSDIILIAHAITRAKDVQLNNENRETAKLLAQSPLSIYARDNLRVRFEDNPKHEREFKKSKQANDELAEKEAAKKKEYIIEAEGKIVKDKLKYSTDTGEYDQISTLRNYDNMLKELASKDAVIKQSMTKALTNERHAKHAFKFKSNLTLSSSLKPIDNIPLSQQDLTQICNDLKAEANLVEQRINELKKRFFDLPNEIETLSKKIKDDENRFKILSGKKDNEMSSDEKNELNALKEQKAQLSELQKEKNDNEQELKRLRPYEIKSGKEKPDQEKTTREKELDALAPAGKKSDLEIIYSLETTLKSNANFNSKQLALIVKYYQFQDKIKKQEVKSDAQKSNGIRLEVIEPGKEAPKQTASDYKYSYTAGRLSLLTSKYKSFDGKKELEGFYQDYLVVKDGALYRRNLEARKQTIEQQKDSTKTADKVAKLLAEVRDIVEIDIKKEITKEDNQYHNPPQSRIDAINIYLNIIYQKFDALIKNMERKLAKEKHGYHPEYKEAAKEVLEQLKEERKIYQTLAKSVQAELKLITEDQFKLDHMPIAPVPIQQRNVQTEVRASPVSPISKSTDAPITSPPKLVQPIPKDAKTSTTAPTQEVSTKKKSGFFSWFSKKEVPKHDGNTGMTKLLMSEGGSTGNGDLKQKATEKLQAIELEKNQETRKGKEHTVPINYVINTHQPNTLKVNTNISESNDLSTLITKFIDDSHIKSFRNTSGFHMTLYCQGMTSLQDLKSKIQLHLIPNESGAFHLKIDMHSVKDFDPESHIVESIVTELKKQGIKIEKYTLKATEAIKDVQSLPHEPGITDIKKKENPSIISPPRNTTTEPSPQHVNIRKSF